MLIGAGLFAALYPRLQRSVLAWRGFGTLTLPELLGVNAWLIVPPVAGALVGVLILLERAGL